MTIRDDRSEARYVSYIRVSTDKQGASGLGLDAQREAVRQFLATRNATVIAEHVEIESGSKNDRPQLREALDACRRHKATLIIAKLDRLARNVAFVANLMDSDTEFVACDNPHASRLVLHILAAVGEAEREMIRERTRAALAKVVAVALANKMARIVWALMIRGETYRKPAMVSAA